MVISFASKLADLIPAVAVRLRRVFPTVLALIEAHALLGEETRERTPEGAVIATLQALLCTKSSSTSSHRDAMRAVAKDREGRGHRHNRTRKGGTVAMASR